MPFIEVKTNQNLSETKKIIKSEFGTAITAVPGKSESWLMVKISDELDMWFKGSDEPCAIFEVSIFGKAGDAAYDALTKRLCAIAERYLNVPSDRTYVKYTEIEHWGYNGFNF